MKGFERTLSLLQSRPWLLVGSLVLGGLCSTLLHSMVPIERGHANLCRFGAMMLASMRWRESPNFDKRPEGVDVDTIVIHATVVDSIEKTVRAFRTKRRKVSCHYTIGKRGHIVQHVDEGDRAWHAGISCMRDGRESVNDFSIGIELVNRNDGIDPYPPAQIDALRHLITEIASRHPIAHVVGHVDVARPPGRKSDPAGFEMTWLENCL